MNPFSQNDYGNPRRAVYRASPKSQNDFGSTKIDYVLREIQREWEPMLKEDFDPVAWALDLMDSSSVGKQQQYSEFQRILEELNEALESIVNVHYKGFDSSIRTSGAVLQNINDSQQRVAHMKNNLQRSKDALLEKRTDLLNMWSKSQQHKEMMHLLETIEDLRKTPEKLDNLMSSKHVLAAADLLVSAIRTAHNNDMMQIGALDDVRRILESQKNRLYELLIEELHNHLYLKSKFCDSRWKAFEPNQQNLPVSSIKPRSFTELIPKAQAEDEEKENIFALDENDIIIEDAEKNPETDSYYYMEIIMEAMVILDQVQSTLETIQERLPLEVHALVDKTIAEVEKRHASGTLGSARDQLRNADENDIYCLDKANSEARNEILKDFLWTLYSKMEAMLRGQRFVETCARRINKRRMGADGGKGFAMYHFHEIWKPVQTEIRSLLQDYLTSRERPTAQIQSSSLTSDDSSSVKSAYLSRDKARPLFKFTDEPADPDLADSYNSIRSNINVSFKKQIPGFTFPDSTKPDSAIHSSVIDRFASDMTSKGHKLLIKPDAYNVSVLVKPTMAFLQRLKDVFPNYDDQNEEGFDRFLDDFAVNVFLPQIEEKVMQLVHQAVGPDAFQDARSYKNFSKYPVVKSVVALISIIQSLCRTMHNMPFHTEEYIRMIESILLKFYDEKCCPRFYSMVATNRSKGRGTKNENISISGDWAQEENLLGVLGQNPFFNDDVEKDKTIIDALNQTEIKIEFDLKKDRQMEADELIFDQSRLVALGRLYYSLKWLVREFWEIRTPKGQTRFPGLADNEDTSRLSSYQELSSKQWVHGERQPSYGEENTGAVLLPLNGETARRFDPLLTTYQQLAKTCLFTLRLEARCHTIYYLQKAIREGNYFLEGESSEPDPYVITLNEDLVELNECVNASLPRKDEMFIFDGLPALIVKLLLSEAVHIKRMNKAGVEKMLRNILALRQNLSNFVLSPQSATMERAREYYALFNLGGEYLIRSIEENGPSFTFDEYMIILGLIHDVNCEAEEGVNDESQDTSRRDSLKPNATTSEYSDQLMKLMDLMDDFEANA